MQTEALVRTVFGEAYLKKLCRHFARKVPVTVVGNQGLIEFPFGRCRIDVKADQIRLRIEVNDVRRIAAAEQTLTDHLLRLVRPNELVVRWRRSGR